MSPWTTTPPSDCDPRQWWHRRYAAHVTGSVCRETYGYRCDVTLWLPPDLSAASYLYRRHNLNVVPLEDSSADESAWTRDLPEAQAWVDAAYAEFVQHFLTPTTEAS